jgi:ABC-type Na+ transport system ATPase subunit NatA
MAIVTIESIRAANLAFTELNHLRGEVYRLDTAVKNYQFAAHHYQKAVKKCDSVVILQESIILNEQERYEILQSQLNQARKDAEKEIRRVRVRSAAVAAIGVGLGIIALFVF